jgi:hypothetical protein
MNVKYIDSMGENDNGLLLQTQRKLITRDFQ